MKNWTTFLLLLPLAWYGNAQDLELRVHVLPPAQLGDNAAYSVLVKNTGEEIAEGVEVTVDMGPGLELVSHTTSSSKVSYDPSSGIFTVGTLEKYQSRSLSLVTTFKSREGAILSSEVSKCLCADPDSTPGNGVDTNGNGILVHDKGDEDDGDAAEIRIP